MESGVTVAVLLRWEPPKEGDLPVHNYRITWMSRHTHATQKHKHTLQAHTHTVASNTHARPAQGRKESNSRVTQGVSQLSASLIIQNKKCGHFSFSFHDVSRYICFLKALKKVKKKVHSFKYNVSHFSS